MEKPLEIRFLEFLEPKNEIPIKIDVKPFMIDNFDRPDPLSKVTTNEDDMGAMFLRKENGKEFVLFWGDGLSVVNKDEYAINGVIHKRWWDTLDRPFEARITDKGEDFLNEFRVKNILSVTNQSIIDTNNAVKTSLRIQKRIGYVTTAAIVLTAIYSIITYYKDDSENLILIRKAMQRQDTILKRMQQSQKGIDSSLSIMAKKTSTKK